MTFKTSSSVFRVGSSAFYSCDLPVRATRTPLTRKVGNLLFGSEISDPSVSERIRFQIRTPPPFTLGGPAKSARKRYVADLETRGEAALLDNTGKLPLQATHVITGRNPDGSAIVRTVRLKAF